MTRGTIDSGPGNGAFSLVKKKKEKGKKKREILNWFTRLFFLSLSLFVFFASGFVCPYFLSGELDSIDVATLLLSFGK